MILRSHCAQPFAGEKFFSRSLDVVIRVNDEAWQHETHEHTGDFKIWQEVAQPIAYLT